MSLSNNKYFVYSFKDRTSTYLENFLINKDDLSIFLVNFDEFIIKNNDSNSFLSIEEVFDYYDDLYFIHKNMSQILLIHYDFKYKQNFFLVNFGLVGLRAFFINKNFLVFVKHAFFIIVKYLKNFFILIFLLLLLVFKDSVIKEDVIQAEAYNISQKKLYQGFEFFVKNNNIKEFEIINNNKYLNKNVEKKLNKNSNYKIIKKFIDADELYFLRMKTKNEL